MLALSPTRQAGELAGVGRGAFVGEDESGGGEGGEELAGVFGDAAADVPGGDPGGAGRGAGRGEEEVGGDRGDRVGDVGGGRAGGPVGG